MQLVGRSRCGGHDNNRGAITCVAGGAWGAISALIAGVASSPGWTRGALHSNGCGRYGDNGWAVTSGQTDSGNEGQEKH